MKSSTPLRSRIGHLISRYWLLVALLVLALAAAILIRHVVYPAYSWNRDEITYKWQVSLLHSDHIFGANGGFPNSFWPWLTGNSPRGYFSQYTLGWPMVMLSFEVFFGSDGGAILLGVAALVGGTYAFTREVTRDHRLAILTTALMLASPFFAVQSGVYLGYLFSMGLGLLFGATFLAGARRGNGYLVATAALLLGYLFITRPFDAVLWAAAIGVYAVLRHRRSWRQLRLWVGLFAIVCAPFLLFALAYNKKITGSFTQFPFTAKDPLDTFGFGPRRLMPNTVPTGYSGWEMVRGELRNFFYLPHFLVGAWFGVIVAFWGFWLRRRERSTIAFVAVIVMFPLGYAMFWGIRLSSYYAFLSAPLYLLPLYVPICAFIGTVILWLWDTHRIVLTAALCLALALITVPFLLSRLDSNQRISRAQIPWREAGEEIPKSSLVFVGSAQFLMHLNPFSRNGSQLEGDPLYATDQPLEMLNVIAQYPHRKAFLELTNHVEFGNAYKHPYPDPPTISIVRLHVVTARQFIVTARVRARSSKPIIASLRVGARMDTRVLTTTPTIGDVYETQWRLKQRNVRVVADDEPNPAGPWIVLPRGSLRFTVRTAATAKVARPFAKVSRMQRYSFRNVNVNVNSSGSSANSANSANSASSGNRTGTVQVLVPPRQIRVRHDRRGDPVTREVLDFKDFRVDIVPVAP